MAAAKVIETRKTPNPAVSPEDQAAYDARLAEAAAREAAVPPQVLSDGTEVAWQYLPGTSQEEVLNATPLFELLYHGTRGPGKTDCLLMMFARQVGVGHGAAWRGVIFRQTYPQLADVQAKSEKWFPRMFGNKCKFNRSKMMWEWNTGEVLMLRHMNRVSDYWNYHGHEYPFIGWEELTNWASDECYKSMFSCCRCSTPGVPRMIRATTNPYGVGHNWVKDRFQLHGQWWKTVYQPNPVDQEGRTERPRAAVHGHIDENAILLRADPDYKQTIISAAANPAMAEAWLSGSWDIVAGGMFGDVWDPGQNIVPRFKVPPNWKVYRAFDWGSSAPFSVGWWAESDGSDVVMADGRWRSTVRGDVFRMGEWYGWNGKPNKGLFMLAKDIAKGMVERELGLGIRERCLPGPADSSIYNVENGNCIADDMRADVRLSDNRVLSGVVFTAADKRPGSRKTGWQQLREMMAAAHKSETGPREQPGLFVMDHCEQFIRTVPALPRDEKDLDDVDTDSEDHIGDEVRYFIRSLGKRGRTGRTRGT